MNGKKSVVSQKILSNLFLITLFSLVMLAGCSKKDSLSGEWVYPEAGGVQQEGSYTPPAKVLTRAKKVITDVGSLSFEYTDSGILVSGYALPSEHEAVQAILQSSEIRVRGQCDSPRQSDFSCMIELTSYLVGLFQSDPDLSGAAASAIEEIMPELDAKKIADKFNQKYRIAKTFVVNPPDKTRSDIVLKQDDDSSLSEIRFRVHYQDVEMFDRIFSVVYSFDSGNKTWVLRKAGSVPSLGTMTKLMKSNEPDLINDMTVSVPLDPISDGRVIVVNGELVFER